MSTVGSFWGYLCKTFKTGPHHTCRWKAGAAADKKMKTTLWHLAWTQGQLHALACLARNASPEEIAFIQSDPVPGDNGRYTALHHFAAGESWGNNTWAERKALDEITEIFPGCVVPAAAHGLPALASRDRGPCPQDFVRRRGRFASVRYEARAWSSRGLPLKS